MSRNTTILVDDFGNNYSRHKISTTEVVDGKTVRTAQGFIKAWLPNQMIPIEIIAKAFGWSVMDLINGRRADTIITRQQECRNHITGKSTKLTLNDVYRIVAENTEAIIDCSNDAGQIKNFVESKYQQTSKTPLENYQPDEGKIWNEFSIIPNQKVLDDYFSSMTDEKKQLKGVSVRDEAKTHQENDKTN